MSRPSLEYEPRRPGEGALYQIVRDHFETFRRQAARLREGEGLRRPPDGGARRASILYYGVLGARAACRRAVVARAPGGDPGTAATALSPAAVEHADDARPPSARGRLWAELMRRTFGFDVLACPRCGGRLRLVALIEEARVIARILGHLGLPTDVPEPCVARAPPFGAG